MTANQTIDRATPEAAREQFFAVANMIYQRHPADVRADSDALATIALALKRARLLCGRFLRTAAAHDHRDAEEQRKAVAGTAYTLELLISDLDAKIATVPWYYQKSLRIEDAAEAAGDGF